MGSQKTTSKVSNPELEKTIGQVRDHYTNEDGSFKTAPHIDPYSAQSQGRMDQLVAGQSQDTLDAYGKVRAGIGQWQPGMNEARGFIQQSGQPVGQKIDFQGGGWAQGADGQAQFNWDDAYGKSYDQYTGQVVDHTLGRLSDTYDQQRLADQDRAIKSGSFGGSRQGVQGALTNEMHQRAAAEAAAQGYSAAHQSALGQANNFYNMGSSAVGANNAIDAANSARQFQAGQGLSAWENQAGQLRYKDATMLDTIGKDQQAYEQSRRDALFSEGQRDFMTPATIGGTLAGMAAPLNTTTQSTSGGLGSMLFGAGLQGLGSWMGGSDERAKKTVRDVNPDKALIELRKLAPKSYAYTDDAKSLGAPEGRRTGFMAQDLEKATGEEAPEWAGGYKGVDMFEHMGRLTQAIIAIDRKMRAGSSKAA